jgi:hypothetical protein
MKIWTWTVQPNLHNHVHDKGPDVLLLAGSLGVGLEITPFFSVLPNGFTSKCVEV